MHKIYEEVKAVGPKIKVALDLFSGTGSVAKVFWRMGLPDFYYGFWFNVEPHNVGGHYVFG